MFKINFMKAENAQEIERVIGNYFEGIYYGNTELLKKVFHPQALLIGDVKGNPYFKTVSEYLDVVKNRKSPYALGEMLQMKIRSVEQVGAIAYARLVCPMLGFNYYDFLALQKNEDGWVVMSKLFTHSEEVFL
jgi:hypothetical protein